MGITFAFLVFDSFYLCNMASMMMFQMLIAAGGIVSGYNGSFAFEKPGDSYPFHVPYAAMRMVTASDHLLENNGANSFVLHIDLRLIFK